jgi:pilus assembly protein CpaB
VVVAGGDLPAGRRLSARDLAVREVPERYAPAGAAVVPEALAGGRLAVAVPRGAVLGEFQLATEEAVATPPVEPGERAAEVVGLGAPELVVPGARVDVLVTRDGEGGEAAGAELALEDVEVLAARPAPAGARDDGAERVAATLRVSVRDAVYLAAAQSFARELRLLPRASGDRGRAGQVTVGPELR